MNRKVGLVILLAAYLLAPGVLSAQNEKQREALQNEEQEDYYKKWLKEDVVYVITPEEKAVFQKLTTPEEKEQFIEQFWYRRDPDLTTGSNEFKEEHYRRIAYANERFASGIPGWMTDRGRIYIIHGAPAEIESHPSGGTYNRPMHEGGGTTSTFPFEIWRYRHIDQIGQDIELEFVDPSFSGEYRLALRPEEKDALLHVPGAGLTLAEELGMAEKKDRPYFSPGNQDAYPFMYYRAKDNPFQRYETYVMVQRPLQLKYKDLKEIVDINVTYNNLPFKVQQDYFRLNEGQVLVPITLELANKDLTFKEENGVQTARLAIYGIVTSITNRVIKEFEDEVITAYQPQYLQQGLLARSMYQKVLPLDKKMRYKLDLVIKDLNSGHIGVTRTAIIPPTYDDQKFMASSLILSDSIRQMEVIPKDEEMFVLGDVKVRPNLSKEFSRDRPLAVYLQLYNAGIDQTTLAPSLLVNYTVINKEGEPLVELTDESGESVQFFSGQRIVLVKVLPVEKLNPGDYRLKVQIQDRIKNTEVSTQHDFKLSATNQMAANQ